MKQSNSAEEEADLSDRPEDILKHKTLNLLM